MGIFDKLLPSSEEEDVSLEEIVMNLESTPYDEETTPTVSTIIVSYIVVESNSDIYKVKEAIKNGEIVILNYDNIKGTLKQKEFLISLNAALKEYDAEIRKIKNSNILIITPKNAKIIKRWKICQF